MQRVDIDGYNLQSQLTSRVSLSAYLHFHRWNRIQILVEAGDGEATANGLSAVVGIDGVALHSQQLHTRHQEGHGLPSREGNLGVLLGRYGNRHVSLLANEDAVDRIELLLYLHALRLCLYGEKR